MKGGGRTAGARERESRKREGPEERRGEEGPKRRGGGWVLHEMHGVHSPSQHNDASISDNVRD